MIINNAFNEAKKQYLKNSLSTQEISQGWNVIETKINSYKNSPFLMFSLFKRSIIFAILILTLLIFGTGSIVNASKHSKPGDFLYPVKEFSDKVIEAFTKPEEKKPEDIENSDESNIQNREDEEINEELDEDDEQIQNRSEDAKEISDEIKKIIDEQFEGEVKGLSDTENKKGLGEAIRDIILNDFLGKEGGD